MSQQVATHVPEETLNDLSDYFHAAPVGLHLTTADGAIKRTNLAELELLGYTGREDEYLGRHVAEFHADSDAVQTLLDRLVEGETVTEYEATLLRRDGKPQKVLLYANAVINGGRFGGVRCFTFPHPDDPRPEISEIGALTDQSVESRRLEITPEQRSEMYGELRDFFDNGPVGLHIVGGDGLVKYASKTELAAMGYDPEEYLGAHIAGFHADQAVIDGMLNDLVGGTPLINFGATLFRKDGSKLPVMIYSNSRMRDGSFVNTRCFTVPVPRVGKTPASGAVEFSWPRNEDFGFTLPGRERPAPQSPATPMTLALKYIASRKRPEESLGFLASVSRALGSDRPLGEIVGEALTLSVPFLADFASVDLASGHLADASAAGLRPKAASIVNAIAAGSPLARYSVESVRGNGETEVCFDLSADGDAADGRAAELLRLGARSLIMAPLTIRARHVGVLTLLRENLPTRRNFGPADLALAEELARRLSFAVEIDTLSARA